MADLVYNGYPTNTMRGLVDHDNGNVKVALVTVTYTADQDAHEFFSDITNEITGTGYSAGGELLTGKTVTQDNTNNRGVFDATDATWTGASFTARAAVMYLDTGTPSTSPLMRYIDFGSDQTVSGGTFTLQWDGTDAIITISS
jgi:hypothetical protein